MVRWLFADRTTGRIVVAQWPNLPLWVFLAMFAVGEAIPPGSAETFVRGVGKVSLSVWALDEILRGVNPWRRLLGAAVAGWLLAQVALVLWRSG